MYFCVSFMSPCLGDQLFQEVRIFIVSTVLHYTLAQNLYYNTKHIRLDSEFKLKKTIYMYS